MLISEIFFELGDNIRGRTKQQTRLIMFSIEIVSENNDIPSSGTNGQLQWSFRVSISLSLALHSRKSHASTFLWKLTIREV